MNVARDEILARLRVAAREAGAARPPAPVTPATHTPALARGEVVARFVAEAALAGASVYGPFTPDAADLKLTELFGGWHVGRVLAWSQMLPLAGVLTRVRASGVDVIEHGETATLAAADVGLTGALAGLADTGTIALTSGAGQPRLAWLLPPIHVAILRTADIFPTMAQFVDARLSSLREVAHLAFVTGPSRTADIELTLTRGVHGPKEIHLLLVDDVNGTAPPA